MIIEGLIGFAVYAVGRRNMIDGTAKRKESGAGFIIDDIVDAGKAALMNGAKTYKDEMASRLELRGSNGRKESTVEVAK